MKNLLKILILILILVSCNQKTEKKNIPVESNFNLKTDYVDFKHRMTELDTLNIFIEHSVCTSSAKERIEITKKNDSLKVKSEYYSTSYQKKPNWELIYNKTISENDTIWDFENFLVRNENRMSSEDRKSGRIQIRNRKDTIHLFTKGLIDLFDFIEDYGKTADKLCPQYLFKVNQVVKIESDIKETELKTK